MRGNRSSGSVEGAAGNRRPYSDRTPSARLPPGHRSMTVCESMNNPGGVHLNGRADVGRSRPKEIGR